MRCISGEVKVQSGDVGLRSIHSAAPAGAHWRRAMAKSNSMRCSQTSATAPSASHGNSIFCSSEVLQGQVYYSVALSR